GSSANAAHAAFGRPAVGTTTGRELPPRSADRRTAATAPVLATRSRSTDLTTWAGSALVTRPMGAPTSETSSSSGVIRMKVLTVAASGMLLRRLRQVWARFRPDSSADTRCCDELGEGRAQSGTRRGTPPDPGGPWRHRPDLHDPAPRQGPAHVPGAAEQGRRTDPRRSPDP